jgi:hypothetical protein
MEGTYAPLIFDAFVQLFALLQKFDDRSDVVREQVFGDEASNSDPQADETSHYVL